MYTSYTEKTQYVHVYRQTQSLNNLTPDSRYMYTIQKNAHTLMYVHEYISKTTCPSFNFILISEIKI